MMHLNQKVPLAYTHVLELMVTIYVIITPVALVPSMFWVAVFVSPVVTLFFYGFFKLGTSMLMDPFKQDSGFDSTSMLSSSILCMDSLERNVPLGHEILSPMSRRLAEDWFKDGSPEPLCRKKRSAWSQDTPTGPATPSRVAGLAASLAAAVKGDG